MRSGFIIFLAALLVLAASESIDILPPDSTGQEVGAVISRWPTFRPAWDQKSPYINKFEVRGNAVKRISKEDQRYQILLTALPCQGKTKVSFKVKSYAGPEHGLFFGIISEKRYFEKSSQGLFSDTCALYTKPLKKEGNIYMNGYDVQSTVGWNADWFVPEGGIVDIEVDLSSGYITFINRATMAVQKVFLSAQSYRGPKIYFFVNAYYANSSFELL